MNVGGTPSNLEGIIKSQLTPAQGKADKQLEKLSLGQAKKLVKTYAKSEQAQVAQLQTSSGSDAFINKKGKLKLSDDGIKELRQLTGGPSVALKVATGANVAVGVAGTVALLPWSVLAGLGLGARGIKRSSDNASPYVGTTEPKPRDAEGRIMNRHKDKIDNETIMFPVVRAAFAMNQVIKRNL